MIENKSDGSSDKRVDWLSNHAIGSVFVDAAEFMDVNEQRNSSRVIEQLFEESSPHDSLGITVGDLNSTWLQRMYDSVILMESDNRLVDPKVVLDKVCKILNPSGRFLICFPIEDENLGNHEFHFHAIHTITTLTPLFKLIDHSIIVEHDSPWLCLSWETRDINAQGIQDRLMDLIDRLEYDHRVILSSKMTVFEEKIEESRKSLGRLKRRNIDLEQEIEKLSNRCAYSEILNEKFKIEKSEHVSFNDKISSILMNELDEERRILKEYAVLESRYSTLERKMAMFEGSRLVVFVTKMWKVINKVRHP